MKPRELVEIQSPRPLSLQTRRVFNLLIQHAWPEIDLDRRHVIAMKTLRGPHKGGERVRESIDVLMQTLVVVPTFDTNGNRAIMKTQLLGSTTTTDDEGNPKGEVRYRFNEEMREILKASNQWGRIRPLVMFAFTSKYSLSLYEALCVRRNLDMDRRDFSVDDFRRLLGVEPKKLGPFKNLKRWAIDIAVEEINGLSDMNVTVEPIRKGGTERGKLMGFRVAWARKNLEEWLTVLQELLHHTKDGRKARLALTVEEVGFGDPDA